MSVFHVLYETYKEAEKKGQVDEPSLVQGGRNIVVLPLYHMNLRANAYDVVQLVFGESGIPMSLEFLLNNTYTIFPVTEDSLNRTSNVFAHPLCDDMQYLSKSLNPKKYESYCKENEKWLNGISAILSEVSKETEDIKMFLQEIRSLLVSKDLLLVLKKLLRMKYKVISEDKEVLEVEIKPKTAVEKAELKIIDLSKLFVTFKKEFSDSRKKSIEVSRNQLLHQAHVAYIQNWQSQQVEAFAKCDVSGGEMYCTNRNRGLLGKGKLVSVSNNTETYRGRLTDGAEIIHLGADTSECIHLMLKFFLEHEDNSQRLYNNTTAIIWFAKDILNERKMDLSDPVADFENDFGDDDEDDDIELLTLSDLKAREWKKIVKGNKTLTHEESEDFFYLILLNKISNGRIAIQSSRTIPITIFVQNLQKWQETCRWEIWDSSTKKYETKTPRPWDIIRFVYGVEKTDGKVDCLKDELKSLAFKRLLPSVIDGFPLPKDMARKIFTNYKNRIRYRKNWIFLQYLTCALINKVRQDERKEKRTSMLEKEQQTRDYLYGRLLAVYEKVEMDAMKPSAFSADKKEEGKMDKKSRVTNVEKVWSAFFQAPERMLETLHMKIRPYLDKLKADQAGSYSYYNKLIGEIQTDIRDAETYLDTKNKSLNEDAVFGYYAQNRELYKSN